MNQQAKAKALSLAYEFVTKQTGCSQSYLVRKLLLNKKTLCRIRDGRVVRDETCSYALSSLYKILDDAYMRDISVNGGVNSALYHKMDKELLRAILL